MEKLKSCPFCGNAGTSLSFTWNVDGDAVISCSCGVTMRKSRQREHYEKVDGDLYRKIPSVDGKDIAREAWNRRVNYAE